MKKLINFKRNEDIQALANNKYGGNFSLAVNSIMDIALSSDDFLSDVDVSKKPINGEPLSGGDVLEIMSFIQSDAAKIANIPTRMIDAAMMGFDASLFNERFKMLFDCESSESKAVVSKLIHNTDPITMQGKYLKTAVELATTWLTMNGKGDRLCRSEKDYHDEIENNFNKYFPDYKLIGREWVTNDGADRIDILAECKKTGRDVIIELKVGCKSAHKQLRSYAYEFDRPILVNISEDSVKNKRSGIIYKTFEELGVNLFEE